MFGSSASALSPFTWARYSSHSPLSVVRRSAWSTVIPQPRAQPSAALLGLPSASNACAMAGPRFSTSRSGWDAARLATFSARRRGAANHSILPCARPALSSSAVTFAAKDSARLRRAFGGSSSVPISTRKVFSDMAASYLFRLHIGKPRASRDA